MTGRHNLAAADLDEWTDAKFLPLASFATTTAAEAHPHVAPQEGFDLGELLRDLPRPLPLVDLERAMAEERAGHRAHMESMMEKLRESERERELVHLQMAVLKEQLLLQAAVARRALGPASNGGEDCLQEDASGAASDGVTSSASSNWASSGATARLEYAKNVMVRYLETHDQSLLPALREVQRCLSCLSVINHRSLV